MKRSLYLSAVAITVILAQVGPLAAKEAARTDISEEEVIWNQLRGSREQARAILDGALMRDPGNVRLNFLNGLAYDAQSTFGSEERQLAKVGYLTALRSDPTFWQANYQLGLLAMEEGNPVLAQQLFIAAANQAKDEKRVFYAYARAAYCAGDIQNAQLAVQRAVALSAPKTVEDLTTVILISAAAGNSADAEKWLTQLSAEKGGLRDTYLAGRVAQLLRNSAPAAGSGAPAVTLASTAPQPPQSTASDSFASKPRRKMAVVDVVIIKRSQSANKVKGINLLDSLALQLGGNLINSERTRTVDRLANRTISDVVVTDYGISLTFPAIMYSLNIANSGGEKSSIDAHPTILVYDGKTAKIFSGGTLTYAAGGELTAQSFTKEVGLSLSVTPQFNDDSTVTLNISTTLETFSNSDIAGSFKEAVQTEKSSTDVIADLQFGQTVLVSAGLFHNLRSGGSVTPIISSLPIIGNLFKQKYTASSNNDLIVLLSLRNQAVGSEEGKSFDIAHSQDMAEELWRKLEIAQTDGPPRIGPEDHNDYYFLSNPGRAFDQSYFRQAGLKDALPH